MKILWIPHIPTDSPVWDGNRQSHLLRHLRERHELHLISWTQGRRLADVLRWGHWRVERRALGTQYTIRLAPNFYRLINKEYPTRSQLALNQWLFRRALRRIYHWVRPDVAVFNASHHWTGFPRFEVGAPVVFEHVDLLPAWVERRYVENAAAVVTVSPQLEAAVRQFGKPATVISNGVDVARYHGVRREEAKAKLDLSGRTVVSLIGLTCSPSLYFLDAFAALERRRPDMMLLIVGAGQVQQAIARKARLLGIKNVQMPGHVPSAEVHWHFAATDVGLYPGEDTDYYRHASPLKIVEYSAVGAQVISSPVDMFRQGWPNVHPTISAELRPRCIPRSSAAKRAGNNRCPRPDKARRR